MFPRRTADRHRPFRGESRTSLSGKTGEGLVLPWTERDGAGELNREAGCTCSQFRSLDVHKLGPHRSRTPPVPSHHLLNLAHTHTPSPWTQEALINYYPGLVLTSLVCSLSKHASKAELAGSPPGRSAHFNLPTWGTGTLKLHHPYLGRKWLHAILFAVIILDFKH